MSFKTIQNPSLVRNIVEIDRRLKKIESYFSGTPISSARIKTVIVGGSGNANGEIFVRNADDDDIVILNQEGIIVRGVNPSSDYITFRYLDSEKIAVINFLRGPNGGYEVSELKNRVIARDSSDRITYWTAQVETNGEARDAFFQISARYDSNTFTDASMSFSKAAQLAAFSVFIDNTNGDGFMEIPKRASNPGNANRRIYYNTTVNRFRFYDTQWRDLIPAGGWNGGVTVNTPFGVQTWTFTNGCLTNIT